MFACAHPAIDETVRSPLILQTVLGLDAATIAPAFLAAPATMGQRLVRAKRRIREIGIPFCIPDKDELPARVDAVLSAIYAAFTTEWIDLSGVIPCRQGLAEEAIWLARLVVSLLPGEPEALGLLALMLYVTARRDCRRNVEGRYVPLSEQDPTAWDCSLIDEAEELLFEAGRYRAPGHFQLEAAVQSVHAARRLTGCTDWPAILELYEALSALSGSPVIALNQVVAVAEVQGTAKALAMLDALHADGHLENYQPYWAARASLLARSGAVEAAGAAYDRAITLETDPAVIEFLQSARSSMRSEAGKEPR
jgi:RNA polymerase sigma-70 factor (ECF subfamily)